VTVEETFVLKSEKLGPSFIMAVGWCCEFLVVAIDEETWGVTNYTVTKRILTTSAYVPLC